MSFAGRVEYCQNDHLKNTLTEFANNQYHSLEIVVGIGQAGLMIKALMPCFLKEI